MLAWPSVARAERVVVFPLDARGVAYDTAGGATQAVLETMRAIPSVEVIEPATVEREIGVDLTEQAQACDYDVFCLVEVGEVLRTEKMLIGHVRLLNGPDGGEQELKLIVLDVAKATIVEVLIWKFPTSRGGLLDATRAATKRLFANPDALVVLDVRPAEAKISFYGDPVVRPSEEAPMPYWSGTYLAVVEAEGFQTKELRVVIPPSKGKSRTRIPIELDPDLLYVPEKGKTKAEPFAHASRRQGSGVSAQVVGAVKTDGDATLILEQPWPYITAAVGIAAGVAGGILMANAQGDYNDLSVQPRYTPGVTVTAGEAIIRRDDARSGYRIGSALTLSGVGVLVATVVWVIVDYVMTDGGSE